MSMRSSFVYGYGFKVDEIKTSVMVNFIKKHKETFCQSDIEKQIFNDLEDTDNGIFAYNYMEDFFGEYGYSCELSGCEGFGAVISNIMSRETGIRFEYQRGCDDCGSVPTVMFSDCPVWCYNEVEKKLTSNTDRAEMSEILYDMDIEDVLVYETDGSLDEGFEIISKPMSFNYIVENKDFFNKMIDELEDNSYKSYSTQTCGHHIHISKSPFTTRQIEIFVALFEYYKEEFTTLSRRNKSKLDRWASFSNEVFDKVDLDNPIIFSEVIERCMLDRDKYKAVNLRHSSTIEIRIWRGTLNKLEFLSRIEMLNNIAMYIFENEEMLENMVFGRDSLTNLNLYDIITYKTDIFTTQYLESKDFMEVVNTKTMATI